MSLPAWTDQSPEEARLLNPAFVGTLLWACATGHAEEGRGLPYPLAFVAMPIVLHRATRTVLPRDTRTSMPAWLITHPRALVGFSARAKALIPATKRGLIMATCDDLVSVVDDGIRAAPRPQLMTSFERGTTDEVRECLKRARFIGRWFAQAGTVTTVMSMWGIAP